ncbi:MAG: hypothetical protein JO253_09750, partial [Alphaproteobacteria bacterium]|nr:hypothetical protein [Alphaproteobacteria bacterium]
SVAIGLEDLKYNANNAIYDTRTTIKGVPNPTYGTSSVPGLAAALTAKNWGAVAYLIQFNPNISNTDTGRINRRIAEAMYVLGFQPVLDENHQITSLIPLGQSTAGFDNTTALINYENLIAISGVGINTVRLPAVVQTTLQNALINEGLYVVQPGDQAMDALTTWGNIATKAGVASLSGAELLRINNALSNAIYGANAGSIPGSLVYLPTASTVVASLNDAYALPAGMDYVYDMAPDSQGSMRAYAIGAGVGDGPAGTLYILSASTGKVESVLAPGTRGQVNVQPDHTTVTIQNSQGNPIFYQIINNDNSGSIGPYNPGPYNHSFTYGPGTTPTFSVGPDDNTVTTTLNDGSGPPAQIQITNGGPLTIGNGNPNDDTVIAPDTWGSASDTGGPIQVHLGDGSILTYDPITGDRSVVSPTNQMTLIPPGGDLYLSTAPDGGTLMTYVVPDKVTWTVHIDPSTGNIDSGPPDFMVNSPFPDGDPTSPGRWTNQADAGFNTAQTDPVVLDMSGNGAGVQLTSLAESNAYFDLHGTGFAVHTGWVGPTTGLLVDTPDPTSIKDLFGNASVDGFTALAALDPNHTGVIDASNPAFANLYVWQDANGNGVADPGEVQSLSQLGITSINLTPTVDQTGVLHA